MKKRWFSFGYKMLLLIPGIIYWNKDVFYGTEQEVLEKLCKVPAFTLKGRIEINNVILNELADDGREIERKDLLKKILI